MKNRMKNKTIFNVLLSGLIFSCSSCSDYLDVVPDNLATVDMAFNTRDQAEKALATCYSFMPRDGNLDEDPALLGSDELWTMWFTVPIYSDAMFRIANGFQNAQSPFAGNYWNTLYAGLRECNSFLENISRVPDIEPMEMDKWTGEVIFLKAYYHFYLVRMYGPVPLIRSNLPVDANLGEVKVVREPVDTCFNYIVRLIDEALPQLDSIITNPVTEMGRITKPIAAALKAKVLMTAASPLFNGNNDLATLANPDGTKLFNSTEDAGKWERAAAACKEAIDLCHRLGMKLYEYNPSYQQYKLTDTIRTQLSIRNATTERWNSEIIWANTQTTNAKIQQLAVHSTGLGYSQSGAEIEFTNANFHASLQAPAKIAEMFYTDHGVPISEDKIRAGVNQSAPRTATADEQLYIRNGYSTAELHFNREPRFYATLGCDGGIWYGGGRYDDRNPARLFNLVHRTGEHAPNYGPVTGYYAKKYVHYQNVNNAANSYSYVYCPWTILRLADLYLLYAEAINEAEGPTGGRSSEMFECIDRVRKRAGLEGVKYSWDTYTNHSKYTSKEGMREIIHRERLIEFALEGQRFWDVRRWKTAPAEYATPIENYRFTPDGYYQKIELFRQRFSQKDYFWPIRTSDIEQNGNLVQNIGW
jgi:hypothetical protein